MVFTIDSLFNLANKFSLIVFSLEKIQHCKMETGRPNQLPKFPEDIEQCTIAELDEIIRQVIVASNPFHEDCRNDGYQVTISVMRSQGFRPITTEEYRQDIQGVKRGDLRSIRLWRAMDINHMSSITSQYHGSTDSLYSTDSREFYLPCTHSQLLSVINTDDSFQTRAFSTHESQLLTEEWPTHNAHNDASFIN